MQDPHQVTNLALVRRRIAEVQAHADAMTPEDSRREIQRRRSLLRIASQIDNPMPVIRPAISGRAPRRQRAAASRVGKASADPEPSAPGRPGEPPSTARAASRTPDRGEQFRMPGFQPLGFVVDRVLARIARGMEGGE
ncbi:hypothetical protein J5Y09_18760 [Roseomonas sp. PWR1]|uniref:Uncharacterized protein n=1 Tax=Roseomonas nitratireducens TaxID=2820810 RepID=A0ABS4AX79_9PROT|nr:hypothetical protein [Neoroseomonas nitratireducens]MBP0465975.1 hypothetical protein [Neoroseomonas nitratireducens]